MDNQQERPLAIDISWLAGLWEADGSFCLHKNMLNQRGVRYQIVPQISLTNTDPILIMEAKKVLNRLQVGYYEIWRQQDGLGTKLKCDIRLTGMKRVKKFLDYMLPYIRGMKKQRVELILQFCNLRLSQDKLTRYGDREWEIINQFIELKESSTTNTLNKQPSYTKFLHHEVV